jgi:hypothetical protein
MATAGSPTPEGRPLVPSPSVDERVREMARQVAADEYGVLTPANVESIEGVLEAAGARDILRENEQLRERAAKLERTLRKIRTTAKTHIGDDRERFDFIMRTVDTALSPPTMDALSTWDFQPDAPEEERRSRPPKSWGLNEGHRHA